MMYFCELRLPAAPWDRELAVETAEYWAELAVVPQVPDPECIWAAVDGADTLGLMMADLSACGPAVLTRCLDEEEASAPFLDGEWRRAFRRLLTAGRGGMPQ